MSHNTHHIQVIGFDLGHGETALTQVWADKSNHPESIELNGQKSIITAVAKTEEGKILYGIKAIEAKGVDELDICFKNRPSSDEKLQISIGRFSKAIYQDLINQEKIAPKESHLFFVGCPSGWSDEERNDYKELLASFGGIRNLTVVKESRAAMMHVKERIPSSGKKEEEDRFAQALNSSILVIDLGSSTADFTCVTGLASDTPLDFGCDLGASLIDKAILELTLDQHKQKQEIEKIFKDYPRLKVLFELKCREAKEQYFKNPCDRPRGIIEEQLDYEHHITLKPSVDRNTMGKILNQGISKLGGKSWIAFFRDTLESVKETLVSRKVKVSAIFLTGGASRMDFVPKICK